MNSTHGVSAVPPIIVIALFALGSLPLFLLYTGMRRTRAVIPWLAAVGMALITTVYYVRSYPNVFNGRIPDSAVWVSFLILFGTAFGIRLYRKWLDGDLTEAERSGGTRGLRAWLSPANLLVAAAISIFAWQGLGWSLFLMLVLTCGALVLWPALHAQPAGEQPPPPMQVSREREKVLDMLEAGKITAEESAELLHALGASSAVPETPRAQTVRPNRLVLCGAAFVLVGFLLPWFSFSPAAELSRTMKDLQAATGFAAPGFTPDVAPISAGAIHHVRGGNIAHGLGWVVLILALSSALLPYLAQNLDRHTQRTLRWVALGAGGIVLLYLVSQDMRLVGAGLVLAIIGYGCEAIGLWQGQPLVSHAPAGVEARV